MADEVDAYTSGPVILQITVHAQGTEVPFEFAAEKWGGLPAAGIASLVGAEKDQGLVRAGPGAEAEESGWIRRRGGSLWRGVGEWGV